MGKPPKKFLIETLFLFYSLALFNQVMGQDISRKYDFFSSNASVPADSSHLIVLQEEKNKPPEQQMLRVFLRNTIDSALEKRKENFEKIIREKDSIEAYQHQKRKLFLKHLGEFPEKTPLNARIVGEKEFEGYRLQKVIYESQPQFYVTALFYLPKLPQYKAPYPAVLVLCGHSENGKAYEKYQKACILLAKRGFAVLCPDPIGQGERKQILTESGDGKYSATLEHNIEGVAPLLIGKSLANYMIWDGIRSIDYLVSRPEVDSTKIGCTGISGGGNLTSYLMALEDRIDVAAPGCFITTIQRKNESPGPGDFEQNIYAQIADGMDHADYLHMRAPKPTLILSATLDFVPIEGSWQSYREAKRLYTRLGYASQVSLIETYAEHGFSQQLREGVTEWMQRWLKELDRPVHESAISVQPDSALLVTPRGQTLLMPGAISVFDLNIEKNKLFKKPRNKLWNQLDKNEKQATIREVSGIRKLDALPQARVEKRGEIERDSYHIQKIAIWPSEDMAIPGLLFVPEVAEGDPYLYLHGDGKDTDAYIGGPIEELVKKGHTVLAVDLSGLGETQMKPWRYRNAVPYLGSNLAEFFNAYRLGVSLVRLRAEDILHCVRFLQEHHQGQSSNSRIQVIAVGEAGLPALHAVALEEQTFNKLTLKNALISWEEVIHSTITKDVLNSIIPGALEYYDLPDLASLIDNTKIDVVNPVNALGEQIKR